jgi:hypothetical protein
MCCSFSKGLLVCLAHSFWLRCRLKRRICVYTLFLVFLLFSCLNVKATEPQTVYPLADTYVDASSPSTAHGQEEWLKISDNKAGGLSIALLMFNLSEAPHDSNVPFEAKLRLYGMAVNASYVIGAHWCVNNTWNESTLAFVNFTYFSRTKPESVATLPLVYKLDWYEWDVTDFVSAAIREKYENITFALEAEETVLGSAFAIFYSKDQQQLPPTYNPQLVFTYQNTGGTSLNLIGEVTFGVLVTAGIIYVAYRFLKKQDKRRRRFSHTRRKVNAV